MLKTTITIPQTFKVTHEQFQQIAAVNRELRLERTATGELIVMPPTGSETGNRNLDIVRTTLAVESPNQAGSSI